MTVEQIEAHRAEPTPEDAYALDAAEREAARLAAKGADSMEALEARARDLLRQGDELHAQVGEWAEQMRSLSLRFAMVLRRLP